MSLQGNASPENVLRGRISGFDTYVINAYDIAVKNGFEGTEEEWLASLVGPPGPPVTITNVEQNEESGGCSTVTFSSGEQLNVYNGKDGQDGQDGLDGQSGNDGKSAYQYAQDGGYTGSEEEFAELLAAGSIGGGGIPMPASATVGQAIVVSEVDEDGKITATKTVELESLPVAEEVAF